MAFFSNKKDTKKKPDKAAAVNDEKNKKPKKVKKTKEMKTVQQSIPYTRTFRDGTFETKDGYYTRAFNLEDINFKIAPDQEQVAMFRSYGDLLNTFPANMRFQIIIQNHHADRRASLNDIRFNFQKDGLNKYRQEMNNILLDKLTEGKKSLTQDKYLVISTKDNDILQAMKSLDNMTFEVDKSIRALSKDVSLTKIPTEERLGILYDIYNQDRLGTFFNDADKDGEPIFNMNKLTDQGLTTKDAVAPTGMEFQASYFKVGQTYGRAFFLENVPTWLSTEFISDLSDVACNLIISIQHQPIETLKAIKMVKNHMTAINAQIAQYQKNAVRSGYSYDLLSPELTMSKQQTANLMDDMMGRDQKLYYVTFTVCVFADTKDELTMNTKLVTSVANKHLCPLRVLDFQQEAGLNSCLPLCIDDLSVKRMYTTESASIFIPYTSLELYQKEGIYYGMNQTSGNMIMYSRLSGKNYNGLFFGEPGSGKSFAAKCEIVSVLLRSDKNQIYIIDPESEYVALTKALHGEVVDLAPGSKTYVNPLDMDIDYDGESDPVSMKTDYLVSMIEIMLGGGRTIDPQAKSVLSRCVNTIYRGYLQHINDLRASGSDITCDKASMPTLNMLYNELLRQPEQEARVLANILELYSTGSFSTFAHRSNVETSARIVDFNIKNLGTGMKDLGLHVCLNDIWNKMIENRRKDMWTWIYIDEFYLLLQSDSAARFLRQVWKRARKWHGVPTGIMQNTEDLLRSADSRDIINNTSFIMMQSLPKLDRMNLGDLLQIPESQLKYITNSLPGSGLIYNGKTVLPFKNSFPEDSELFSLMDTKTRKIGN